MLKCCFYCGTLFRESAHRAKQRLRGAFVLLQTFLTDCLRPLCMLGLFMSLVDAAVRMPRACNEPEICHNLPLFPRCLKCKDQTMRVIQLHDGNNAFRNLNYITDACCLMQLSWSQRDLTAKQRIVLILWIVLHLHFQFLGLTFFSLSSFSFLTACQDLSSPLPHSQLSVFNLSLSLPAQSHKSPQRWINGAADMENFSPWYWFWSVVTRPDASAVPFDFTAFVWRETLLSPLEDKGEI